MNIFRFLPVVFLSAGLAACGNGPLATPTSNVVTFTQADLSQAIVEATAAQDTQAVSCFTYLQTNLTTLTGQISSAPAVGGGVFSTFEAGNIALGNVGNVLSPASKTALENACGPLVLHAVNAALTIGAEANMIGAQIALAVK